MWHDQIIVYLLKISNILALKKYIQLQPKTVSALIVQNSVV